MINKIIFVLLTIIVFTGFNTSMTIANPTKAKETTKDIVETAVDAGQFKILGKALEAAGLTDVLKAKGKYTVFAPTDEAFAKLPAGTLEMLLKPENKEKLKAILLYHVVNTNLSASKVTKLNGRKLVSLQGGLLEVNSTNGVKINSSSVVKADVKANNGVIHVIDTVLIPN
jgi:uncharacterized surface protein with fasciclin (FAS1) repeats